MTPKQEKQALEAFEQWFAGGDATVDVDRSSLHYRFALKAWMEQEARGRASGQQGVEGCKLVPVQPTDEMLSAAHCVTTEWYNRHGQVFPPHSKIYKAMLAASPQITSPAEKPVKQWPRLPTFADYNPEFSQPSDSVQDAEAEAYGEQCDDASRILHWFLADIENGGEPKFEELNDRCEQAGIVVNPCPICGRYGEHSHEM